MAKFKAGDRVVVDVRDHEGHCRTPTYLRGKTGSVRSLIGVFKNPEELAYYKDAGTEPLYDVVFAWKDVWGEDGPDEIAADIYEHWLQSA
jgi:hypothetical protein